MYCGGAGRGGGRAARGGVSAAGSGGQPRGVRAAAVRRRELASPRAGPSPPARAASHLQDLAGPLFGRAGGPQGARRLGGVDLERGPPDGEAEDIAPRPAP